MNPDQRQILKTILKTTDLTLIGKALPHCNEQDISALASLLKRYHTTEMTYKELQEASRGISRKIGQAKKQGASTDALMTEMQAASAELKAVTNELQHLEDKLSDYLKNAAKRPGDAKPTSFLETERNYPDPDFDSDITITLLKDETKEWNQYVNHNPAASVYHLADWRDIIDKSFKHTSFYFYAHDSNMKIKGILPLVRLKSRLFGDFMVSMPYFNYGGAIADHPQIEEKLVLHANKFAKELNLNHIEYRDDIAKPTAPERTDKVNMILPLPSEQDALWQSFSPKLRSQIKRPQRENTQVNHGSLDLLDEFYTIFARNMRDLGTPVYGKNFFRHILLAFPAQSSILTVRLDNRPVAGAFLIGYKDRLEIPWASTIRNVNHLSINMLMYWEVLCFAIQNNYQYFDFGRSSVDSGTYKFKAQWGAHPKQLYWHYWLNNRDMPSLNPSNPKYKLLINIWKKLPVWVTRLAGPAIVKNLP